MTDSNNPAPKKRSRKAKEKAEISAPEVDTPQQPEEVAIEGEHDGFPDNAKPLWANPRSEFYNQFPPSPVNKQTHTPIEGGWTYTWDGTAKAWICIERGYQGPEGPDGPEGPVGPRGDVAAVVECVTPPTNASRGVFYLTNNNVLLIGI